MSAASSSAPQPTRKNPASAKKLWRRLARWLLAAAALICLVFLLAVLNNNYSLSHSSRAQFEARRDQSLNRALDWIAGNTYELEDNPTLMLMVFEMSQISHDPRLEGVLRQYQQLQFGEPKSMLDRVLLWLLDPARPLPTVRVADMHGNFVDYLWVSHAVAPDRVLLTPADEANLLSPTRWSWGKRQKQLLALGFYRYFNPAAAGTPEMNATLNHVAEGVARDGSYDFRLTDSYMQRNAILLAAHRPDLVRRRWVERIIDRQNADGSWDYCWYGWCRGLAEFGFKHNPGHSTVQAAWALTMLK